MRPSFLASLLSVSLVATPLFLGACHDGSSALDAPLVSGLSISGIALYQGLRAQLMQDGAPTTTPTVPVVAGRAGLLRVFFKPGDTWQGRMVSVVVELTANGAALPALTVQQVVTDASSEADLTSTVNFDLPAETMTADLTYAVSIREPSPGAQAPGADGAIFPATGQQPMGLNTTGIVKVTLLPVVYGADGSNRVPDTGADTLAALHARMVALYPITDVQITVGAPFPWTGAVQPDGTGWDTLLSGVIQQRMDDGAPPDVYYYGLFNPTTSFAYYCQGGCVAGLSPLGRTINDDYARASIGLGFMGGQADEAQTFVHEVGHAHGRLHAPCMTPDPDVDYPYTDGTIGAWGYDEVKKVLLDPHGTSRDMMGYCDPTWISDYTYSAIYDRVRAINNVAQSFETPSAWRSILVRANGAVREKIVTLHHAPSGEDKQVERKGAPASTGHFYPFDHLPGGLLLIPASEDVGELRVDGHVVR